MGISVPRPLLSLVLRKCVGVRLHEVYLTFFFNPGKHFWPHRLCQFYVYPVSIDSNDQAALVIKHLPFLIVSTGYGAGWRVGHFSCLVVPPCLSTHTLCTGTPPFHSSYCYSRETWCPGQKWKLSKNLLNLSTLLKSFSEPQGIVTHY